MIGELYLTVIAIGLVLAALAWAVNRGKGPLLTSFILLEVVVMAIIGVGKGVLGKLNAMLGRLFMTFSEVLSGKTTLTRTLMGINPCARQRRASWHSELVR